MASAKPADRVDATTGRLHRLERGTAELVGARLRTRRKETSLSVRALASEIGVSPSLVSQIERGKANPSVATLYSIVSVLGISLDDLFFDSPRPADGSTAPPARPPDPAPTGPILRERDRPTVTLASGVRWERLTPSPDDELDFLCVTYEVGGASCPPDALMQHVGREYGLVMKGRLGATVGFDSYELGPGDSIAFDSAIPHRFWTIGDEPSVVVWSIVRRLALAAAPSEVALRRFT